MNTDARRYAILVILVVGTCAATGAFALAPPTEPYVSKTVGGKAGDSSGAGAVCPIYGPDNCQLDNGAWTLFADRSLPGGWGRAVADDFIAQNTTIDHLCWSPIFVNWDPVSGGFLNECADLATFGVGPPPDNWEIRFFADGGGKPGAFLFGVLLLEGDITAKEWRGVPFRIWDYSVSFDPPLAGFVVGERYWLEISGLGNDQCRILLPSSEDGNGYYLKDRDQLRDRYWTDGDIANEQIDVAFCLGAPSTPSVSVPPPVTGACCTCDGICVDAVSREDCLGYTCVRENPPCRSECTTQADIYPCEVVPIYEDATFSPEQTCAETVCEAVGGGAPEVPGDSCTNPIILPHSGDYPFNNNCATTDGPSPFGQVGELDADSGRVGSFVKDIWYQYQSTETSLLAADVCSGRNFDAMLAVYSNGTATCPTGCTVEELHPLLLGGEYVDRECSSRGVWKPSLEWCAWPDICYLVRVGGFEDREDGDNAALDARDAAGEGILSVQAYLPGYPPLPAPTPESGIHSSGSAVTQHKNRFLSFSINTGVPDYFAVALMVTFMDLPAPFDVWNGQVMWVGPPQSVSEIPSDDGPTVPSFTAATLQCASYYHEWADGEVVHVYHEGIIPGGHYEVRAFSTFTPTIGCIDLYSNAAEMTTSASGDAVGSFVVPGGPWSVPDGSVDVATDVIAVLDKFGNAPTAPSKTRVDLEPAILDFKINITDAVVVLDAFAGTGYPFAPSSSDPCSSE